MRRLAGATALLAVACDAPPPAPTQLPPPLATLTQAAPAFTPSGSGNFTLRYDAGATCTEFFDITYGVAAHGVALEQDRVTHPPGRRGVVTLSLIPAPSHLPFVFAVGTHVGGSAALDPCAGWTITIYAAD